MTARVEWLGEDGQPFRRRVDWQAQAGDVQDEHVWVRNTGDRTLVGVTVRGQITPSIETRLSVSQCGPFVDELWLGTLAPGETMALWIRSTATGIEGPGGGLVLTETDEAAIGGAIDPRTVVEVTLRRPAEPGPIWIVSDGPDTRWATIDYDYLGPLDGIMYYARVQLMGAVPVIVSPRRADLIWRVLLDWARHDRTVTVGINETTIARLGPMVHDWRMADYQQRVWRRPPGPEDTFSVLPGEPDLVVLTKDGWGLLPGWTEKRRPRDAEETQGRTDGGREHTHGGGCRQCGGHQRGATAPAGRTAQ